MDEVSLAAYGDNLVGMRAAGEGAGLLRCRHVAF
jgi:hypothetical protein